jgi:hypothetical protein
MAVILRYKDTVAQGEVGIFQLKTSLDAIFNQAASGLRPQWYRAQSDPSPVFRPSVTVWKYLPRPPGALYAAAAKLRSDWSTQKLLPGMKKPVCFQSIQKRGT